ncbi:MAG: glycosyltransferase family 2 protein [Clostridia bacterium]|nr:glycosyltransferase family 2 protein [Clostridia bacterium]
MEKPIVSVIMPTYNSAAFVEVAIRSVMNQTYDNWKLFVIDDGSSDNTCSLVERLCEEDSRITLIRNEVNMGVAATRNKGLDLSVGSWVALLDSDDWWHPEKLEKQLALAEKTGADIIYCSYGIMNDCGEKICDDFFVPAQTDYKNSMIQSVISCSTALLSKRIVETYRFRNDYYHEDMVLWLELLQAGFQARGEVEVLAKYRVSQGTRASNKIKNAIEKWKVCRRCMKESFFTCLHVITKYGYLSLKKYRKVQKR